MGELIPFVGMDVHKESISVGVLNPGHERPDVERIFNDEESVRRLIARFDEPHRLRACNEAGPMMVDGRIYEASSSRT